MTTDQLAFICHAFCIVPCIAGIGCLITRSVSETKKEKVIITILAIGLLSLSAAMRFYDIQYSDKPAEIHRAGSTLND